jgi:glycosyltransferase involved in cell wall biosynthesis
LPSATPLVSLVIPCYREGARLPVLLDALVQDALAAAAPPTEILVVDDGSGSLDVERERSAAEDAGRRLGDAGSPHQVRFVPAERNRGKGAAIRLGWSSADPGAAWLGFLDADGAVGAAEAWRLVRMVEAADAPDVLAGTRMLMAGRRIERSLYRHLQGRVFATITENLLHLGFYDTQCGVKLLRASRLRPLLASLREERWLLDIEVLVLMQRAGASCREIPIDWSDPGGSKVVPGVDAIRMLAGLSRLGWRIRRQAASR